MPTTPLLDPTTLDLTRVAARKSDIYSAVLQHAGRFALLDGVLHRAEGSQQIVGFKDIRADDWWCSDHIPGRPIFPGVLMIETAAHLCSYDYKKHHHSGEDVFLGFGGTNETRFRGLVQPSGRMIFVAEPKRIRKSLFTYAAQGFWNGELVFESEIIGVVV
ncbi:MAG: hypothetical protein IPJ77_03055 [Planctomycetes bacterium]|nr:hypothetical protein [Planctomycetota bacterium]